MTKSSTPESGAKDKETETTPNASSTPSIEHELDSPGLPTWRLSILYLGLSSGLFLSFLDTSIVTTSIYSIAREFGELGSINWVALAYTLAYLSCAVLLARVCDVIGRRNAFVISYIIFIAFSIGCGFAQNLRQLIACRALQGFGGSGLYSITMIVLPEISPPKMRKFIAGLIGIVITLSSVLGPILGGVLTLKTWRWVFWINAPIGAVSMLLFYVTWPKPQYLPSVKRRSWGELDYFGSLLLIAAAVLVVFPFQNAEGATDQWSQAIFIAPVIAGVVSWAGLLLWSIFIEQRWGDEIAAAIPMCLLRNRAYASAALHTMFIGFPYMVIVYTFPQRLQVVHDKDALISGIMLLPMLGSSAVGSIVSGKLNGEKDRTFETLLVATGFMVLGCGLLSTLSSSYDVEQKALGFLVFVGLGFGMAVSTTTMLAAFQSPIKDHAPAQGIIAQLRVLGGSIGIAASSAVLGVTIQAQLEPVQSEQPSSLEADATVSLESKLNTIRQAYSEAFNKDMRICTIISGIAILLTFGTFSQKRLTVAEHRERQVREEISKRQSVGVAQVPQRRQSNQEAV
ncbi:major facilitator superfamily transporter [Xylariaceae sp. FL0662B]|nr:major facilitator superfamily transporter [Xylariaceae sp. FL0662B]